VRIISHVLISLAILLVSPYAYANENILQRLWENTITPCRESCEIAEFARGQYIDNGAARNFVLLQRAREEDNVKTMSVRLEFIGNQGDKYLLNAESSVDDLIKIFQLARYHKIDISRTRRIVTPPINELGETQMSPFFLTLSLQLLTQYKIRSTTNIQGFKHIDLTVYKNLKGLLPDEVKLILEEKNQFIAPTRVVFIMYDEILFAYNITNVFVNGKLRPSEIIVETPKQNHVVHIDTWGLVEDYSENSYFGHSMFSFDINLKQNQ
jgi:hypothetical protein